MRHALFVALMVAGPLFKCTGAHASTSCRDVRVKLLSVHLNDIAGKASDIETDLKDFKKSPRVWTDIVCGDVYEEGDETDVGYQLCMLEKRVCK